MFWIVSKREKAGAATFGRVSPLRLFGCGEVRCGEVWGGEGEDWIVGGYLDLFRKNDAEADCQTRHFYGMIDET
ncbi:hypothetical protein [Hungatella sp.]|uniref:hypothetical protein n=1 Tax=Hungatella sp. TaxID=2613924 RepID=UPI002A80E855|nr:hypothetical protein [Hungatella sp.]